MSFYPARGVQATTMDVPFNVDTQSGGRCDVELLGVPISATEGSGERFDYSRCSVLVRTGGTGVVIAPRERATTGDDFVLSECLYRLAMYLEGYRGALAEPTETMFQERTSNPQFAGLHYAGPSIPWLPRSLALHCPQLMQFYYKKDLSAAVQRVCPDGLRRTGA
jgi:hypothetical protein